MASGEWTEEAKGILNQGAQSIAAYVTEHPDYVALWAMIAIYLIIVVWVTLRMRRKAKTTSQGEQDEMKRRVQLEETYSDKIHDFMLDMLVKGQISRKEYKRDCKRFGIAFRLSDLLRPPRSKIGIKHKVIRNVAANHATLPFIQPGPGPKPGEEVPLPPVGVKRKVWLVVGKRRSSAA